GQCGGGGEVNPGAELVATGQFLNAKAATVSNGKLYWLQSAPNTLLVWTVPVTGGTPSQLAELSYPYSPAQPSLVVDATHAYVGTFGNETGSGKKLGHVRRVPLDGSSPDDLAEDV